VGEAVGDKVHASALQMACSEVAGHSIAMPSAADVTSRVRRREPPSHAAEQSVHALQSLTVHSTHSISEHAALSETEGHAAPPLVAASLTNRDLREVPIKHCALHVVHAPHEVTAQSTGQTGVSEQSATSSVIEHAMPP
jgi:hypothetical protein